jgi:gamma-glutamylcyclotransferase (GGCT)/AIG2-like uncharacterized protein YtfP
MSEPVLYFAYGSNLHPPQMQARCPDCGVLEPATLEDWRLAFAGLSRRWGGGAGTIVATPGAHVAGLLYRLSAADLKLLDGYESHPTVYERFPVAVRTRGGEPLQALTYRKHKTDLRAPSLRYFHQIWRSYKAFGLDEALLLAAVEEALAADGAANGGPPRPRRRAARPAAASRGR